MALTYNFLSTPQSIIKQNIFNALKYISRQLRVPMMGAIWGQRGGRARDFGRSRANEGAKNRYGSICSLRLYKTRPRLRRMCQVSQLLPRFARLPVLPADKMLPINDGSQQSSYPLRDHQLHVMSVIVLLAGPAEHGFKIARVLNLLPEVVLDH